MTSADVLVVASLRRWVADDFADPAAVRGLPVIHSYGLDLPDLDGFTAPAWWTPLEHAAVLRRHGLAVPLLAPGPDWLTRLPASALGRGIWSGTLDQLASGDGPTWTGGFAKLAEAKAEHLPAAWWGDLTGFTAAARAAGIPGGSRIHAASTRLDLDVEVRTFALGRTVLTASPYLAHAAGGAVTWFDGMADDTAVAVATRDGAAYAADVIAALRDADVPPVMTLDVARTTDGRWLVLEANPVSSSAAYGADMDAVLTATLAGTDLDGAHPGWAWQPDPYLLARAARHRDLTRPIR